jgi:uracil-DNA glycosylase family 4
MAKIISRVLPGLTAGSERRPATGAAPGSVRTVLRGNENAPILIVCEPNSPRGQGSGMPMDFESLQLVARAAMKFGLERDDFQFVSLCPPISEADQDSAARKWKHVEAHMGGTLAHVAKTNAKVVLTLGDLATRAVHGKSLAITKARGSVLTSKVGERTITQMPMLSPAFVSRIPDHLPTFEADMLMLAKLKMAGWQMPHYENTYEWREDISDILANPPELISLDTETTGLRWWDENVRVLTMQFSYEPGHAIVVPVHRGYWPDLNPRQMSRLRGQVRQLVGDRRIRKVGHNIKFDDRMMSKEDMPVAGWIDDTQLMAFAINENMMSKGQDECVRVWVPEMAGYSDEFDAKYDKARMIEVPHDDMLQYAGGDADSCLRLRNTLNAALMADRQQRNCYTRILMPGIMSFARNIEQFGIAIDKDHLRTFGAEVRAHLDVEYRRLIQMVPAAVRMKHMEKGLEFSRGDFVHDILFTPEGFNLKPVVFTKSTRNLKDEDKKPSTSTKDHLPFFADTPGIVGEFVTGLMDYQKTDKLSGTYIGLEEENSGFWKYIAPDGNIYPSYMLHQTVTGRTASADPNGQNFPKRGRLAKSYLRIFKARPGFKIVSADLSQIELRIAAWMAMDKAMLDIYRQDGDIHTSTAKYVSGLSDEQWDALDKVTRKLKRTQAKAVNFGFLYGMGWQKFMNFAKTDYGVTYTEKEAQQARERFFTLYSSLTTWHDRMRDFVRENGYVRALHGARRNLPSIFSNDKKIRSLAERQAINSPVQRFGSDLGLMAVIRFAAQANKELFRVIGFVHDAVLVEAREGHEQECMSALVWTMENQPLEEWFGIKPPLPLKAEADVGINFGETLEMSELPPVEKRPAWFNEMGFDSFTPERPDWWDDNVEEETMSQFAREFVRI